jgi:Xaa-Pro aminopeptidase
MSGFTKEFYENNRKKFGEIMENGSLLVIFTGAPPIKRGTQFYDYTPQRNFLYLTGIDRFGPIFMMKKDYKGELSCRLYLERFDETYAKWEGAPINAEDAKNLSGIESFFFVDELDKHLATAFVRERLKTVYMDLENRSLNFPNTSELELARRIREKFPVVNLIDAHPLLGKLRMVKAPAEIEAVQKAVELTGEGFYAFLDNVKPGMMEYEVEAHWEYIYKKNGANKAFRTIMASGANATVLHYGDNNCEIGEGDLVLVDFGGAWQWYSADISRTFPASGKFTERQKELYEIVLGALKKVTGMVAPGVKFEDLNEAVKEYYNEHLTRIGLISGKEEIVKYYYHGVGHMMGLEVHDVGAGSTATPGELTLEPGMIFTLEPGLYIAEEKIGIRIEDNILVTESGYEVLSKGIIKEADEIEKYMANRG